jgi:hypothetical protein
MKKQNIFRVLVATACLAVVPLLVSAQPGGVPPTGNVNAIFNSVAGNSNPLIDPSTLGLPYGGFFGVEQLDGITPVFTTGDLGSFFVNPAIGGFFFAQSNTQAYGVLSFVTGTNSVAGVFLNANGATVTMADLATKDAAGLFTTDAIGANPANDTLIATTDGFSMKAPQQVRFGSSTTGFVLEPNGDIYNAVEIVDGTDITETTGVLLDNILTDKAYGTYVGKTGTRNPTTGALSGVTKNGIFIDGVKTGYAAGQSLCNTAYTGSHVCNANEIINSYELTPNPGGKVYIDFTATAGSAWINNGPPAYITDLSNDCGGWKSSANNDYGSTWSLSKQSAKLTTCDRALPIACCAY